MKLYFIFTRRKLVAAALLLALTLCIAGRMVLVNAASIKASDDEARVRFAAECGCEVEKKAESVKKVLDGADFVEGKGLVLFLSGTTEEQMDNAINARCVNLTTNNLYAAQEYLAKKGLRK